jgi:uncharacterized delta-60 repeat protein
MLMSRREFARRVGTKIRPRRAASRLTCEAMEQRRLLAAAPVDVAMQSHFGVESSGYAVAGIPDVGPTAAESYDLALLPSGKALFAGGGGLSRLTDVGEHDPSFGDNGHVGSPWPGEIQYAWWNALLMTAGDHALVGGTLLYPADASRRTPVLARYADDGTPDGTFGHGSGPDRGVIYLPFTAAGPAGADAADGGSVRELAALPDGSYLAAGFVRYDDRPADPQDLALWKILPDGTPDPSFGDGGLRVHDLADGAEAVSSVIVRPDGSFYADTTGGVVSFDPTGAIAGRLGDGQPSVIAPGPGGTVVTAQATADGNLLLQRFGPDGSVDPAFGSAPAGGPAGAMIDFGGQAGTPTALVVLADGRVLVAAPDHRAWTPAFGVVALNPDGSPDAAFGTDGRFTEPGSFAAPVRLGAGAPGRLILARGDTVVGLMAGSYVLDPGITLDPGGPYGPVDEGTPLLVSAAATYSGGEIATYEWDVASRELGGIYFEADARGSDAAVTFPDETPNNLALRVTTSDGLVVVRELAVDVRNVAPTLPLVRIPTAVPLGVATSVSGSGVDDPGTEAVTVVVDFGDGTAPTWVLDTSSGSFSVGHTYAARGTFRVKVTADDGEGGSTTVERDLVVADVVGNVFRDSADDGRRVPAKPPVAGATVYVDTNGNGTRDTGEPSAQTDADGFYFFPALDKGTYFVRLDAQPGFRATIPAGQEGPVVVTAAGPGTVRDFGLTERARITGAVFNDLDADGVRDPGEAALRGASPANVYLDLNNNGWYDPGEPKPLVAPPGLDQYVFPNLVPGTYTVRYQPGLTTGNATENEATQTFPNDRGGQTGYTVTVGAAEVSSGHDFGSFFSNTPITGTVYLDRNRDGVRGTTNAGEGTLGGRFVYLDFDGDGTLDPDETRSVTFDRRTGDGYFLPTLRGHTYTVRTVIPDGWTQSQPAGGAPYVITVEPGAVIQNRDFGTHLVAPAAVVGRHLFYYKSAFSGAFSADPANDSAIAPDKEALLPGQQASFANVSSYSRGVNGVMVDLNDLNRVGSTLNLIHFAVGDGTSAAWTTISSQPAVQVRRGAGVGGSDRLVATFADGVILNKWLRVTVDAGLATGLAAPDVFYFGNLVGETGDALTKLRVSAADLGAIKRDLNADLGLTGRTDFNRDGRVNALDLGLAKSNLNRSLAALSAPAPAAPAPPFLPARDADQDDTTRPADLLL